MSHETSVSPLRPDSIQHSFSVVLPDGNSQTFTVAAISRNGALDLTVEFAPGVEEIPEAVPSELLDQVQIALEQMRRKIQPEELAGLYGRA